MFRFFQINIDHCKVFDIDKPSLSIDLFNQFTCHFISQRPLYINYIYVSLRRDGDLFSLRTCHII